ncbi:MAG: hypothetical protein NZM13_11825 [Cyclobacteriaceae bacterium]|nr:hypothetical protein [Cyclobacteriaceae bacterium]MDW8332344.1 hypothetical protein [Cyclobacteriaceae bacterium]
MTDMDADIKSKPNHQLYLHVLMRMTPDERLAKAFALSAWVKHLFLEGLKKRFPEKTKEEIHRIYLDRLTKCYNRNY